MTCQIIDIKALIEEKCSQIKSETLTENAILLRIQENLPYWRAYFCHAHYQAKLSGNVLDQFFKNIEYLVCSKTSSDHIPLLHWNVQKINEILIEFFARPNILQLIVDKDR